MPRRFRHHRGDIREDRKLQRCRALHAGPGLQGDPPHAADCPDTPGKLDQAVAAERSTFQQPLISQVPLKVNFHALTILNVNS